MARDAAAFLALSQSDSLCLPVPLAHPFGMGGALAVLMAGGTLVLPAAPGARALVEAIEEHGCSAFLADTHLIREAKEAGLALRAPEGVRGVVKVGGGNAFGLGPPVDWSGLQLGTAGKPA